MATKDIKSIAEMSEAEFDSLDLSDLKIEIEGKPIMGMMSRHTLLQIRSGRVCLSWGLNPETGEIVCLEWSN